jgi:PleD family two-component response regulator
MLLIWPLPSSQSEAAIQAELIAQKVQQELSLSYKLNGRRFSATFSIGVCLFHGHLDSLESLLKNAESSVNQAKAAGRNTIRFFDPLVSDGNSGVQRVKLHSISEYKIAV